jgi:chromosomal replication initiation ATPase DnaA
MDPHKIKWNLKDLISRFSSFVNIEIKLPDDNLIQNILVKQFSDRQFSIEKKLIEYISFRIERSYLAINNIVNLIDELTLKYKKPVSLSIVKEALLILNYKS